MLVADEWDVSVGGAWFLSAGLWWPTSSGLLLAGYHDVPKKDRYVYGVVSGTGGVALAVAAMSLSDISEGDAALAHSGGVLGMGLGGLTQLFVQGRTNQTPIGGMGYGAALGTLGAGVLATQVDARLAWSVSLAQLAQMQRDAVAASFLPQADRDAALAEIEAGWRAVG
jgi:hypothetical protein